MQPKNERGNYYVMYVLGHGPKGTDSNVWSAAVTEYLRRHDIDAENCTPQTTMANVDWPEIRRLYNRLVGEGKQRRTADSTAAPADSVKVEESGRD